MGTQKQKHDDHCQIVNKPGQKNFSTSPLTIFAKTLWSDVWLGFKYTYEQSLDIASPFYGLIWVDFFPVWILCVMVLVCFPPKIWVFIRIETRAYDNQEPKAIISSAHLAWFGRITFYFRFPPSQIW